MKQSIMEETCQLSDFEENLYKVVGSGTGEGDMYLIATSEQPISALYRKEWLGATDVPKRYAGVSSCFRKEAGAHGKDVWGIFRVHQFEKVEQFCITTPENSW
jgi:seryl-tRNA synthetase